MRNWYEIKAYEDSAEVLLYGYIGRDDWDDEATSAGEFIDEIEPFSSVPLTVRINSGGGSVFDGIAIFNAIKRRKAETTTCIDALAASAASIIAMAGDRVVMSEGSLLMIHKAWTFAMGNADELAKTIETLNSIDSELVSIYSKRTGIKADTIAEYMAAEKWINTAEALADGWVDEIDEGTGQRIAACLDKPTLAQIKDKLPEELIASLEVIETGKTKPAAQGADGAEAQGADADTSEEQQEAQSRVIVLDCGVFQMKGKRNDS